MGETYARVAIGSEKKRRTKRLLVDTGSTLTWLRRGFLESIGVKPYEKEEFELMDGSVVIREIGEAPVRFRGKTRTTAVVFAERGEPEVLGMVALETLALTVDPIRRRLRPVRAIKAYAAGLPMSRRRDGPGRLLSSPATGLAPASESA